MMCKSRIVLLSFMAVMILCSVASGEIYSDLWGEDGEKWSAQSRLPDFSFAGYHFGEDFLPKVKAVTDVSRFGAIGDGKTDCTEAFIKAIEATDAGAITIGPGRYVISDIIWIRKPNIVLRGAGPGKTIIQCVTELEDVRPNMGETTSGRPTSNYSWSGGFIWVRGSLRQKMITAITSQSKRGSKELTIQTSADLKAGQRVTVEVRDDGNKTLLDHLYSGDPGNTSEITKPIITSMVSRIASVNGTKIVLERPLRFDIRRSWNPVLKTFGPTVSEVGIENLSIEFPVKPYEGHFTERGMNGIAMNGVSDCWVRNVKISNSDSGIYLSGVFCTADGVTLDSKRRLDDKRNATGHHGISFGTDCLVENFDFRTHFIHDITLGYLKNGNVTKNGKGINLSLDHHKKAPYENLFCNLDVGKGNEIWRCGGGSNLGKHCGARGTFWCIKAKQDIKWPVSKFGPDSMNLVGLRTSDASTKDPEGKWFEAINPEQLQPADLHASQLARRLRMKPKSPLAGPPSGSKWQVIPELTDEFESGKLDSKKWYDHNPTWKGRQPGWFSKKNVTVSDGKLHLTARAEDLPNLPKGYHTFTTAAVKSKAKVLYGYFEVKCIPMKSSASSAFWFYTQDRNNKGKVEWWTEIDVFEMCGGSHRDRVYPMNAHVFVTPEDGADHWRKWSKWKAPFPFTDGYHLYALEWNKDKIKWYVDGMMVRQAENTHWHQPLHMNFDSETFPKWFGLPKKEDLPSTFSIEYVRSWRNKDA